MTDPKQIERSAILARSSSLSPQAFSAWGVEEVAYVRPFAVEDRMAFAIHAANGRRLGVAGSRELAVATIVQNDLQPISLN